MRGQKMSTCLFWFYLTASLVSCLTESFDNMVCVAAFRVVPSAVAHSFSPPWLPASSSTGAVYSQKLFLFFFLFFFLISAYHFPTCTCSALGLNVIFFSSSAVFFFSSVFLSQDRRALKSSKKTIKRNMLTHAGFKVLDIGPLHLVSLMCL